MDAEVLARLGRKLVVQWLPDEDHPFKEALRFTELAVRRSPESAVAWWARAEVLTERERYEEAEVALEKALRLDDSDPNAHYVRALLRHRQGKTEVAYQAFLKAVELAAASGNRAFEPSLLNESLRGFEESEHWDADHWLHTAELKSLRKTQRTLMEIGWMKRRAAELAEAETQPRVAWGE